MPAATCRRLQVIEFARQKAVGDAQYKKRQIVDFKSCFKDRYLSLYMKKNV